MFQNIYSITFILQDKFNYLISIGSISIDSICIGTICIGTICIGTICIDFFICKSQYIEIQIEPTPQQIEPIQIKKVKTLPKPKPRKEVIIWGQSDNAWTLPNDKDLYILFYVICLILCIWLRNRFCNMHQ